MEQRAKLNWSKEHFGDSNPYENLPSMSIYTYNLGQLLSTNAYVELEDKAFNFREFFRVNDNGSFCYESDIKKFLDLITKKMKRVIIHTQKKNIEIFFNILYGWFLELRKHKL